MRLPHEEADYNILSENIGLRCLGKGNGQEIILIITRLQKGTLQWGTFKGNATRRL